MFVYRNEETDAVNIFESAIEEIRLKDNGWNIVFIVDNPEGEEPIEIVCRCCDCVDFSFKQYPGQISAMVITGFSYLKNDKGDRYTVQFDLDFSYSGYIRLNCSEFLFKVSLKPIITGGNSHLIPWDPLYNKDDV